jgi:hypothetical protein
MRAPACLPSRRRGKLDLVNAYSHWSVQDWVAHYGGQQAQTGGTWDAQGRRLPAYATGQSYAQRAQQTVEHLAERGERSVQGALHGVSDLAHKGYETATSPKMLLAGVAVLGILGWVIVQSGRTVGKTVEGVAPHAAKALPLLI